MVSIMALGLVQGYMPQQQAVLKAPLAGMTAGEIAEHLQLPAHAIWFFSVAGQRVVPDYVLKVGEELVIHSPVDGG